MNLAAYVLAADPTWIRTSVLAYYPHVSRIVVSYDRRGRGWSGEPVPAGRCVSALKAIDRDRKIRFAPGDYAGTHDDLMAAETAQRQAALEAAGDGADWVLQIDTDEVLPDAGALSRALAVTGGRYEALAWPMRVLYRRLRGGRYLEVATADGGLHVEYPGPVAVRPGIRLDHARHPAGPVLRVPLARNVDAAAAAVTPTVEAAIAGVVDVAAAERAAEPAAVVAVGEGGPGDVRSAAVRAPAPPAAPVPPVPVAPSVVATPEQVIWHNSWARSPRAVRRKVLSWGHGGPEMLEYYEQVWLPAVQKWEELRDIHPLSGERWPRLVPAPERPFRLARWDRPR